MFQEWNTSKPEIGNFFASCLFWLIQYLYRAISTVRVWFLVNGSTTLSSDASTHATDINVCSSVLLSSLSLCYVHINNKYLASMLHNATGRIHNKLWSVHFSKCNCCSSRHANCSQGLLKSPFCSSQVTKQSHGTLSIAVHGINLEKIVMIASNDREHKCWNHWVLFNNVQRMVYTSSQNITSHRRKCILFRCTSITLVKKNASSTETWLLCLCCHHLHLSINNSHPSLSAFPMWMD